MILRLSISIIGLLILSSCSVLQWRATDQETYEKFAKRGIPTTITYFEVDSLDLRVRVQEVVTGDGAVNLVFFHGSPSSMYAWDMYLSDTSMISKAHLYSVDRPGYGYSNFGEAMTSIDAQAKIMSAILEDKDLKNVIAIGSSYGGPLAARLAVLNKRVKGVIMISPAIDPKSEKKIWQSSFTQWWLTRWLCPTGYRVAGDEKTVHAEELASIAADWSQLNIPVIHIHGDRDDIVPYENVKFTQETFPNIEIVTTPETGHEIAWGRSELIKPHIIQLIDRIKKQEE